MNADSFCESFVDDMLHDFNSFEMNYNTSYSKDTFYSYKMPICKHEKTYDKQIFYVIDKDQSPSITTAKHINKLLSALNKAQKNNPDITIEIVSTFQGGTHAK